jgi:ABC-2 type transport system ATP-binding protein
MIQTENLTKKFDNFVAVNQVSLNISSGEVLALLGPNGAGKTTTLRMLTSVLRPTEGWARVAGYDVITQPAEVRASVGILTEQHGLYGRMSALEYLDFFGQIYHMPATLRRQRTNDLLEQFGLSEVKKQKIGEYSKGMRQKLALARALFHNPPVLLMDEPTSAMDPESARLVRNAIHGLRNANRTIIVCTHNLAEAEELADKIAIIQHGKIILSGTVGDLKNLLLGVAQFEVQVGSNLDHTELNLPECVKLNQHGVNWLRYQADDPLHANPQVVEYLVSQGIPVVSLSEISRSLEKVYLQAINGDGNHGNSAAQAQTQAEKSQISNA